SGRHGRRPPRLRARGRQRRGALRARAVRHDPGHQRRRVRAGGRRGHRLALAGTAFGVVYAAVSRQLPGERRAWAVGMAGALGGLGQFLLVPATQGLIEGLGWQGALLAGAAAFALMLPLARVLREPRPAAGAQSAPPQALGEALREACGHRGFWLLNLGFLACGFQLAFIANHLPAYLADRGLAPEAAVAALA